MSLASWYHYLNTEEADIKTNDWFLVSSPVPIILITFAYLYFVLKCGPRYMENRKPYSFKTFIRLYNLFQVVTNSMIVYHIFEAGWYRDYFIYCRPIDPAITPASMKFAHISWYVLALKVFDYTETVLFVLRKKQRQISFLHLYHHVTTVFVAWVFVKYSPNGMAITVPMVNCGVHVIMYTYYFLATFGPRVQRYLNVIKPGITIIQMVQFVILLAYLTTAFIPGCKDVKIISGIVIVDLIINFYLFYQFYQETYKKPKRS
ncbi:very long chain fatty acid elongase AAEL008004-like [Osmia lignaria lignaria]|uniref:very long chain fatty acid elongase AAEL008004-like n=1 Tax=Osmia lignaria lignaria TaxID=1437193 RepID=UPI00402B24CB